MNPIEIDRLIQSTLDDSATAEERARLQGLLAGDENVRRRHRELSALFQTLSRVPLHPAPADLAARVSASIPARAPNRAKAGGWSAWRETWSGPHAARLAFTFAAGLAAGVIGLSAWNGTLAGRSPADAAARGTMMPSADVSPRDEARGWTLEGTTIRVGLTGERTVTLEISGAGAAEVILERAELGVAAIRGSRPATSEVSFEPGRVRLAAQAGTRFELDLLQPASPGAPLHVIALVGASRAEDDLPAPAPPAAK